MYLQYYGLTEPPFTLNPDPDFLYLGEKHQAAYSRMEYGLLNQAPFCLLTGDVGMGKTVVIRHLINQIQDKKNYTVGVMTNTQPTAQDLLRWILLTFNLDCPEDDKAKAHQLFYDFLINEYAQNRQVVLIVDEAQNLDVETLERLRLLSNINADKHQVLQTFLVGQDGLQEMLKKPELKQFAQRITYSYHLKPFSRLETHAYILHRLAVAGGKKRKVFSVDASDRVFHYSQGTPRLINVLCDAALVYGFSDEVEQINSDIIEALVQDKRKGHILPLSNLAFVPAEGISEEIEALYAELDQNAASHAEVLSEENSQQIESGLHEPEPIVANLDQHDQQEEENQEKNADNLNVAEAIIVHSAADPIQEASVKEFSETYDKLFSWFGGWKERLGKQDNGLGWYGLIGSGGLLLLIILGLLWDFDTSSSDSDSELPVANIELDNYARSETNADQTGLSSDSETDEDAPMVTVNVQIPEQTKFNNKRVGREKPPPSLAVIEQNEGEDKNDLVQANNRKTVVKKDINTPSSVEGGSEAENPEQIIATSEQESVIDGSIEQVKSFFQFITPEAPLPKEVRVVVKQGDTLTKILLRETGKYSQKSLNKILRDNPGIEDADHIYIGQVIFLSRE